MKVLAGRGDVGYAAGSMKAVDILDILRKTNALLSGHFELRSGLHSDQFFQCAHVLRFPDIAEKLCRALVENLREAGVAADGVIAPALGGIVVGHEIARAMGALSIFAEKKDDKLVLRRGFVIDKGQRFVVAEDVITRGGRVQETIDIVEEAGGIVAAVAVLVDRSGGKAKLPHSVFSLLQMEPVTWKSAECPLCAKGDTPVHPGS